MFAFPLLAAPETVRIAPAPVGEPLSARFGVSVDRRAVPVLVARVAPGDAERRRRLIDDGGRTPGLYDEAAFASWDMGGLARVTVTADEPIRSFRVLPTSAGIVARREGRTLSFTVKRARPLTVEINGDVTRSLHLFANPFERNVPRPGDPNVTYFGPGVHEIGHLPVKSGSTVYLAPGAVVRCVVKPGEPGWTNGDGERGYPPAFDLQGDGITLRGRGIIDGALLPVHARNLVAVTGRNVTVEGVILRDSPVWAMPVRRSDAATIENVKVLGYRANSDGIDVCNSRDVLVENCFLRTFDDLIVVKADQGQGEVRGVRVRRCTLWNEFAHALSIGAEIREPVRDVAFEDCDVIHDIGREWTLRVFQSDAALVRDVRFERLRVEESRRLASLWIGSAVWSRDAERGHIEHVIFRDVTVDSPSSSPAPKIEIVGADETHAVRDVTFERVRLAGLRLAVKGVEANAFASGIRVTP